MDPSTALPLEVFTEIMSYASPKEIILLTGVSKRWKSLIEAVCTIDWAKRNYTNKAVWWRKSGGWEDFVGDVYSNHRMCLGEPRTTVYFFEYICDYGDCLAENFICGLRWIDDDDSQSDMLNNNDTGDNAELQLWVSPRLSSIGALKEQSLAGKVWELDLARYFSNFTLPQGSTFQEAGNRGLRIVSHYGDKIVIACGGQPEYTDEDDWGKCFMFCIDLSDKSFQWWASCSDLGVSSAPLLSPDFTKPLVPHHIDLRDEAVGGKFIYACSKIKYRYGGSCYGTEYAYSGIDINDGSLLFNTLNFNDDEFNVEYEPPHHTNTDFAYTSRWEKHPYLHRGSIVLEPERARWFASVHLRRKDANRPGDLRLVLEIRSADSGTLMESHQLPVNDATAILSTEDVWKRHYSEAPAPWTITAIPISKNIAELSISTYVPKLFMWKWTVDVWVIENENSSDIDSINIRTTHIDVYRNGNFSDKESAMNNLDIVAWYPANGTVLYAIEHNHFWKRTCVVLEYKEDEHARATFRDGLHCRYWDIVKYRLYRGPTQKSSTVITPRLPNHIVNDEIVSGSVKRAVGNALWTQFSVALF